MRRVHRWVHARRCDLGWPVRKNFESYRILARATPDEGVLPDVFVPMPPEVRDAHDTFADEYHRKELPTVLVFNDSSQEPMSRAIEEFFGEEHGSVLVIPLAIEENVSGTLALIGSALGRYSDADA